MITAFISFIIFASGYLTAAIEWHEFFSAAFNVSTMKNTGSFMVCIVALVVSFGFPLWLANRVYECAQGKSTTRD